MVHDDLNLTIRRGERWCVMGKNGAGKSTLLKMVAGVLAPDAGSVTLGASLTMGAKSWTPFVRGPLTSRLQATAVWTGTSLIVWGGVPTKTWGSYDEAGGVFTPPALGCGDDWMPENLPATQAVKDGLRVAYLAAHPAAHIGGPAVGHQQAPGLAADGVLHCQVKGDHRARFSRSAQVYLGLVIEEDTSAPSGFALRLSDGFHPIDLE